MAHAIVVTGATGKQGHHVVGALADHSASNPSGVTIYAVSRKPNSPGAQALVSKYKNVNIIQGDFSKPAELVRSIPAESKSSWSMFMISNPGRNEVSEATALIDAAISAGVSHIVYSSVDHCSSTSDKCTSTVEHWQTKHSIEAHLRSASAKAASSDKHQQTTYTIIRPVFLLDNLSIPGLFGKLSATLWAQYFNGRPLRVVDPFDVGAVTAAALLDAGSRLHRRDLEVPLCGDELTFEQADDIFRAKVGYSMPRVSAWVVGLVLFVARDFGRMVNELATKGWRVPVGSGESGVKVSDFETWVSRSRFMEGKSA